MEQHKLDNEIILIASSSPFSALNSLAGTSAKEIWICNKKIHDKFAPGSLKLQEYQAQKEISPFMTEGAIPKFKSLITNGFCSLDNNTDTIEIADFYSQKYISWKVPQSKYPLSLKEFSAKIPINTLPMYMTHLHYLMWKYGIHVA